MARPPGSAIVDPKTGRITPEWLDFLSRDGAGGDGGVTIIKPGPGGGVSSGGGGATGPVDAGTLVGTTLASNVIFSSLSSVGVLTSGMLGPGFVVDFNMISARGQIPWTALPSGTGTWSVGQALITGVVSAQAFIGDGSGLTNVPFGAHALTHQAGGTDPIKLDALALPDDVIALNATSSRHGLLPKLSGVATQFLNGLGAWTEPGSIGGGALAPHASTHMPGGADVLTLSATARVLGRVSAGAGPVELLSYIDLPTTTPGPPVANVGRLHCLDLNGYELFVAQDVTGADLFLTRDMVTVVKVVGQPIARGQAVYISGASGSNVEVQLARADVAGTLPAIGLALDSGAVNAFIRVITAGKIAQVDTSLFTEGARLFVSVSNAGGMTTTPPPYPNYIQRVGVVTRAHATQGEILVLISGGVRDQHAPSHETGGSDPITALAATVITTGTLNDARLSPNVLTVPGGYPGSTGVFLRGDGAWAIPSGGAGGGPHHTTHEPGGSDAITALDASVLTTGTVNDARLSANVALRNGDNTFTGVNQINTSWFFNEPALAPNTRLWKVGPTGGTFYFSSMLDGGVSGAGGYVSITRDGTLEASKHLRAAQDVYALNGAFYGSGIGLTNLLAQNLIGGPLPYSVVTVSASRVLGRGDSGSGAMQEITIGFGLAMTGTTLSATGSGGSGGPHHVTHEPGGSDQIIGAAWLAQANIFIPVQRFNAGVRIVNSVAPADARVWSLENTTSGAFKIHPLTDAFADKPTIYVSFSPTGDLIVSQNLYAVTVNLSGRLQWGTTASEPMISRSGVGLEARLADNSALTTFRAHFDASDIVTGTLSDARLSINVLKTPGGYPGGTTLYLRADGTWATPPGSGVQGDEVFIGPADPGAAYELWYDTDEPIVPGVQIHATTHYAGGTDPVTVTSLAGFPGGTTMYLRADGSWASPPGGTGGGVTDALYWVSTAHSGLSAEVSLGALASGYLKITTTAGSATPSSVAAIPQSDITNLVTDLAAKAPLASPALTGVPTAPTAADGTSTTQLATTAFVQTAVLVTAAPKVHAPTHNTGGIDPLTSLSASILTSGTLANARLQADVVVTSSVSIGANTAGSGHLRLPSSFFVNARNAANTADIRIASTDSADNVLIGNLVTGGGTYVDSKSGIILRPAAGVEAYNFDGIGFYPSSDGARMVGYPSFRFTSVNLSQSVNIGTNPAQSGAVRLANFGAINWRSADNNYDIGIYMDGAPCLRTPTIMPQADNAYALGYSTLRWLYGCFSDNLQIGPNPAATGAIRLANDASIKFRNAANTADVLAVTVDTGNFPRFGSASSVCTFIHAGSVIYFGVASSYMDLTPTALFPDTDTGLHLGVPSNRWNNGYFSGVVQADGGLGTTSINADNITSGTLPSARLPAHATTHKSGGSDAIKLDELAATTDVTTLNASTTAHGLLPKLSGNVGQFLSGTGTWVGISGDEVFIGTADPGATYELWYDTDEPVVDPTPPTGNVVGPATSIDNNLAIFSGTTGKILKDGAISAAGGNLLLSKTRPEVQVKDTTAATTTKGRLAHYNPDITYLSQNLSTDAATWNADDTTKPGMLLTLDAAGAFGVHLTTAGANPRTPATRFQVIPGGLTRFDGANVLVSKTPRPELQVLDSAGIGKGRIGQAAPESTYFSQNVSYDGTNFNLDNTSRPGWWVVMNTVTDSVQLLHAAASANPATLATLAYYAPNNFVFNSKLTIQNATTDNAARLCFFDTSATADNKSSGWFAYNGALEHWFLTDSGGGQVVSLRLRRSGQVDVGGAITERGRSYAMGGRNQWTPTFTTAEGGAVTTSPLDVRYTVVGTLVFWNLYCGVTVPAPTAHIRFTQPSGLTAVPNTAGNDQNMIRNYVASIGNEPGYTEAWNDGYIKVFRFNLVNWPAGTSYILGQGCYYIA